MMESTVGVMELHTPGGLPVRVFYPAVAGSSCVRAPRFNSLAGYISGYVHTFACRHHTFAFKAITLLVRAVVFMIPLNYASVPSCYINAKPKTGGKRPLIVFSHGLSGTGEENSDLLASWAKEGFIVASVHHMDGSSSCVQRASGHHWYEHSPFKNYDAKFRPKQIQKRSEEVRAAVAFLQTAESCPPLLQQQVDSARVVVAGFSYGAATAALMAAKFSNDFVACILLDGWFYIDVSKSAGVEFVFPAEAHALGIQIPCLFLNSEQFDNMEKLKKATAELSAKCPRASVSVLHGTTHSNFIDLGSWFPRPLFSPVLWLLQRIRFVGSADVLATERAIAAETTMFLRDNVLGGCRDEPK
jgi:dienelactone hydrolase